MFHLTPDAATSGTHRVGEIEMPPTVLVGLFGPPGRGTDDGKVTGHYTFTGDSGDVLTLHDYKQTTLDYGEYSGRDWPTPGPFWAGVEPVEFGIGGRGDGTAFRAWLIGRWRESTSSWGN